MIDDCAQFSKCKLFNEKSEIVLENLDITELKFVKDATLARAKYFKYDKDKKKVYICKVIDLFIEEKSSNSSSSNSSNSNSSSSNSSSSNTSNNKSLNSSSDNDGLRKIELPDRPRKESFDYNLVKVGSAKRRTRKNKKKY